MSQFEEAKGGWPPHDSLTHLATHTPIQVARQSEAQGAFHAAMQQGAWMPVPAQFGNFVQKPQLFGTEWPVQADWTANNNKIGEWDKWSSNSDVSRPLATLGAMMHPMPTAIVKTEPLHSGSEYDCPKEEERKSSEHTNSYDVSASQSPSEQDEERPRSGTEEPIDVECTAKTEDTMNEVAVAETPKYDNTNSNEEVLTAQTTTQVEEAPSTAIEDSKLLLNFTQQSFNNLLDSARLFAASAGNGSPKPTPLTSDEKDIPTIATPSGFLHSGNSAFLNIESSLLNHLHAQPSVITSSSIEPRTPLEVNATSSAAANASFCRPPGLGPVVVPPPQNGQVAPLVCPICGFACPSKFHYNSHMNTHGDHQCSMCDYTSRTEGRLKKHMRESHTVEEQMKAGLDIEHKSDANGTVINRAPSTPIDVSSPVKEIAMSEPSFASNLSTTMASLLDSTAAVLSTMANSHDGSSIPSSLSLDFSSNNNLLSSLAPSGLTSGLPPSALDQIRAFTENSSLIPEGGLNLATALGAVSQAMKGDSASPEKQSNGETRRSSSGKVKVLKCKQCGHHSLSKDEQWAHARTHIPAEKQLNCQHCNFVTEYKHHLEYHYRNHIGSKPFQCKKCAYTCVNKSMLNSHMKSHTNHYQFRCMDCTYATKYCHSLKLHLKKYNHRRVPEGIEMNGGDSSPNMGRSDQIPSYPSFGIKLDSSPPSTSLAQTLGFAPMVTSQSLNYASQMLMKHHQMDGNPLNPLLSLGNVPGLSSTVSLLKCPICDTQCATQEEQIRHNMGHLINAQTPTTLASLYSGLSQIPSVMALASLNGGSILEPETTMDVDETADDHEMDHEGSGHAGDDEMDHSSDCAGSPTGSSKGSLGSGDEESQKRKAFKLEQISQRLQGKSPRSSSESIEDHNDECHVESSISPSEPLSDSSQVNLPIPIGAMPETPLMINTSEPNSLNNLFQQAFFNVLQAKRDADSSYNFTCPHCRMAFQDQALYHIHMGYHGYEHAFKCNRCGFTANDSLNFNLHLLQASHE